MGSLSETRSLLRPTKKMLKTTNMAKFGLFLIFLTSQVSSFTEEAPSLVLDNYRLISDKKTKTFFEQNLQDLFTMFRSFFEDNLDHCPECYTTFPRTGNDYKSVNKIDDDVYKVLQLTRLYQPANITKQAFEFLVQLETYIKAIAPADGGGIDIKREAMRLVTLGFYKSRHDLAKANLIYKRMRHFDRKTRFRQSLVTWFANGMGEEYQGVREDLLKHGTELMHLVLRRREFPYDINCIKMRERIKFLIEQSTLWVWQARGLVFSGRNSPLQRQKIMMQGLAGTLLELAWYFGEEHEIPVLIKYSCNQNDRDIEDDVFESGRVTRQLGGSRDSWGLEAKKLPENTNDRKMLRVNLMNENDILGERNLEQNE